MHGSIWTKNEQSGRQSSNYDLLQLAGCKPSVQGHLPPNVKDLLSLSLQLKQ